MQKKSFSKITVFLLALMFSVAVSGGCGGGSSGHYYGNYGNSSRDVTPEPESQDVTPTPENPTSDDEYGGARAHSFEDLHNTYWKINSVSVSSIQQGECGVTQNYNYNVNQLGLIIYDEVALGWSDAYEDEHGNWTSPLTVVFVDDYNNWSQAPILRAASSFKREIYDARFCTYLATGLNANDWERIYVYYQGSTITRIRVYNRFVINNLVYEAELNLIPDSNDW